MAPTTYIVDKDGNSIDASTATVPSDRHFRGAWTLNGKVICSCIHIFSSSRLTDLELKLKNTKSCLPLRSWLQCITRMIFYGVLKYCNLIKRTTFQFRWVSTTKKITQSAPAPLLPLWVWPGHGTMLLLEFYCGIPDSTGNGSSTGNVGSWYHWHCWCCC